MAAEQLQSHKDPTPDDKTLFTTRVRIGIH